MRVATRIWRGSDLRRSRFHDEKGTYALRSAQDLGDWALAFFTTALRGAIGYRPVLPLIALERFSLLEGTAQSQCRASLSGRSACPHYRLKITARKFTRWRILVQPDIARARSARLHYLRGYDYVNKIRDFPAGYFDLISIDGSDRLACFALVDDYLRQSECC